MLSSHKSLHVDLNLVVALIHSCPQKWYRSCSVVVHINNAHVFRSNSSCIEPLNLLDALHCAVASKTFASDVFAPCTLVHVVDWSVLLDKMNLMNLVM